MYITINVILKKSMEYLLWNGGKYNKYWSSDSLLYFFEKREKQPEIAFRAVKGLFPPQKDVNVRKGETLRGLHTKPGN